MKFGVKDKRIKKPKIMKQQKPTSIKKYKLPLMKKDKFEFKKLQEAKEDELTQH